MPYSPDEKSTDRLLKNLSIDLFECMTAQQLVLCGWYHFRDHDHPQTLVAVDFAAAAILYLGFDAKGAWRSNPDIVKAVLAFMARYSTASPQRDDLMQFKKIILTEPLDKQAVIDWFYRVYPPAHQP